MIDQLKLKESPPQKRSADGGKESPSQKRSADGGTGGLIIQTDFKQEEVLPDLLQFNYLFTNYFLASDSLKEVLMTYGNTARFIPVVLTSEESPPQRQTADGGKESPPQRQTADGGKESPPQRQTADRGKANDQRPYWKIEMPTVDGMADREAMQISKVRLKKDREENPPQGQTADGGLDDGHLFRVGGSHLEVLVVSIYLAEEMLRKGYRGIHYIPVPVL